MLHGMSYPCYVNIHGEETAIGRGNLSFTSINLVKLALISGSKEAFLKR